MNQFMCLQSILVTSHYLNTLVYILLQLFCLSPFLIVFSSIYSYITEPKK